MKHRFFVLAAAAAFSVPQAHAADAPNAQAARAALRTLVHDARTTDLTPSPLPGYFQSVVDGRAVFISKDGKYLVQGEVFRFADKADLGAKAEAVQRRQRLAAIPDKDTIEFAPPHPRYRVTVFTDIDCPYCEKLQEAMPQINAAGIAVRYVLFPLQIHPQGHRKAMAVWCAKDRRGAFAAAMGGVDPGSKQCPNPLQSNLALGQELGVNGTPGIFADDGTQLGGYLTTDQLVAKLRAGDPVAEHLAQGTH